ncbi:MAG: hypothetical protein JXA46_15770 [Dehalococcoidales bacterium]|nr:hypothetical protein [Dehalococcoidales bacterium]
MGIEKEVTEILKESEAEHLARELIEQIRYLTPPNFEEKDCLARILEDVARELPCYDALWMAFWLGGAWQEMGG